MLSRSAQKAFNAPMRELPHLTDKAVEFLNSFFTKNPLCKVLEHGTGGSTVWFLRENRARELHSLEHSKPWFDKVSNFLKEQTNLTKSFIHYLKYIPEPYDAYLDACNDNYFDLILVDGYKDRRVCFAKSLRILKPGGVIMLDDAEVDLYRCIPSLVINWSKEESRQKREFKGSNATYKETNWWVKP